MSGTNDNDAFEQMFEALEDAQFAYEDELLQSTIAYLTSPNTEEAESTGMITEPMALANISIS